MDENTYWWNVVKACAVVIVALIGVTGGCSVNKQYVLAQMVRDGADPVRASCALYRGESSLNDAIICERK